jgi:sec-independent protein translocase protein TatC
MPEHYSSKKKGEVKPEGEMTFWEHLEELRWHLSRSAIVLVVLAIAAFVNRDIIFDQVILAPKDSDFITYRLLCQFGEYIGLTSLCLGEFSMEIVNIQLSGQLMTHIYISFIAAILIAFPYFLWEIWSFIKPALKHKERMYSRGAVLVSTILFFTGVLFSYFIVVPMTMNFFGTYQVSESVANTITLSSYVSSVTTVTLGSGLIFEFPIVIFFLTKVGMLTPAFLKRNRKYTLVILLTIAAIITPPDVASQLIVTLPLLLLYELSILVSSRVYKRGQKKRAAGEMAG